MTNTNYEYHLITKELEKDLTDCLSAQEKRGEVHNIYVQLKKENRNGKKITHKIKCIHSVRSITNSRSSLADNLAEGLHKDVKM